MTRSTSPNILFIMCDQMRHDALGCNGNRHIRTPNIDRLAAGGVRFTRSFTPDPICVPARASLTTGCYPHKCTGQKSNGGAISDAFPKLGEEFASRGYDTYSSGKLHYLPYAGPGEARTTHGFGTTEFAESGRILSLFDPLGKLRGLEDYHDYLHTVGWGGYTRGHGLGNNDVYPSPSPIPQEHYVDTWVADEAMARMHDHLAAASGRPFFVWASFPKPHSAFDPPRPYDSMYDPRELPLPIGDAGMLAERGLDHLEVKHYAHMWHLLSPQAKQVIKAYYYGLISHQDAQVGRLLDFLDRHDLSRNTIVVYTSDHGEMLGDFGLYFKSNFYNGSVRVPLMIRYPGVIRPGTVSDQLAGLQDLLPTLLSLAGSPLERQVDGRDLSPAIFEDRPVREYYIGQCEDHPKQQYMIADRCWKYIYHEYGAIEELYDQQEDEAETINLADSAEPYIRTVKEAMKKALIEWCEENEDRAMLDNGSLTKFERKQATGRPDPANPFGRRLY